MLVTADKFYGVTFNNQKVSSIRSIKREEAQEFVDQVSINPCVYDNIMLITSFHQLRRRRRNE